MTSTTLNPFEGRDVASAAIEIPNAGGGLAGRPPPAGGRRRVRRVGGGDGCRVVREGAVAGVSAATPAKGERFVAFGDNRPSARLYITVTRVARDGTWADISVQTWAVAWTKRQRLPLPDCTPGSWTAATFVEQEADHMAMLREKGVLA